MVVPVASWSSEEDGNESKKIIMKKRRLLQRGGAGSGAGTGGTSSSVACISACYQLKANRNIIVRIGLPIMIFIQFYMSMFVLHRQAILSSSTTATTAITTNNTTTSQFTTDTPPSTSLSSSSSMNMLEKSHQYLSLLPNNNNATTKDDPLVHLSNPSTALSSSSNILAPSKSKSQKSCLDRDGIIILNGLGRLANNIFEFAFAKRLSEQLCDWPIIFRKCNDVAPLTTDTTKGLKCFPNANLHESIESGNYDVVYYHHNTSSKSYQHLFDNDLHLSKERWMEFYSSKRSSNKLYERYMKNLSDFGHVFTVEHNKNVKQYTKSHGPARLKKYLQQHSEINVVELKGYFVKSDWMIVGQYWPTMIQNWFGNINQKLCCPTTNPPSDAVVLHFRDFGGSWEKRKEDGIHLEQGISVDAYIDIIQHYNYLDRPLWIVCQPKSANSPFILKIKEFYNRHSPSSSASTQVKVVTGVDEYDALCVLMKSNTLLLSSASTFSQIGAFLQAPPTTPTTTPTNDGTTMTTSQQQQNQRVVHYPITTLDMPHVTIHIPEWKYHLVNSTTLNKVDEFDIQPHDRIKFQ